MDATFVTRFVASFESLNTSVWPLHLISYAIAGAVVFLLFRKSGVSRFAYFGLAVLWIFAGVVFHWMHFALISKSGRYLAVLFAVQAAIFVVSALRPRTVFRFDGSLFSWFGLSLVAFSLIGYPIAGAVLRGSWMRAAWLGVFPCPVGLFTLGLFLLTERVVPKYLLVIPTLWAASGVFPISWGIPEDYALVIGGLLASGLVLSRDYRPYATPVDEHSAAI